MNTYKTNLFTHFIQLKGRLYSYQAELYSCRDSCFEITNYSIPALIPFCFIYYLIPCSKRSAPSKIEL